MTGEREIGCVPSPLRPKPPYGLAPTSFRFAGLAALAGRAPLGGQRETALAIYLAARLADDTAPENGLPAELRAQRAASAKHWLASMALPAAVRSALNEVIDATVEPGPTLPATLRAVIKVAAGHLDGAARLELERLTSALESQTLAG